MKKTLIALMAAASCAFGATETFDSAIKSATIAITMNVEAYRAISDVSFDGAGEAHPFFTFNGTWHDGKVGYIGLINNGSSTSDQTGLFCTWQHGADSTSTNHGIGLGDIFTSATNWDNIGAISLVYSYNTPASGGTTTNIALSISYLDGTDIATFSVTKNDLKFDNNSGFAATTLTVNDTYAVSYTVDSSHLTLDAVKEKSVGMLPATPSPSIPEPATATLSLLALAGLAARRRRK